MGGFHTGKEQQGVKEMTRSFKWVKTDRVAGVRGYVRYDLYIEGSDKVFGRVERTSPSDTYSITVMKKRQDGHHLTYMVVREPTYVRVFHYLDDAKREVERYLGLRRSTEKKALPFGL